MMNMCVCAYRSMYYRCVCVCVGGIGWVGVGVHMQCHVLYIIHIVLYVSLCVGFGNCRREEGALVI